MFSNNYFDQKVVRRNASITLDMALYDLACS